MNFQTRFSQKRKFKWKSLVFFDLILHIESSFALLPTYYKILYIKNGYFVAQVVHNQYVLIIDKTLKKTSLVSMLMLGEHLHSI